MPLDHTDPPTDLHLAEQPVAAYLGDEESVACILTNRRVGVSRVAGEEVRRVEPGSDYGAVAAVTDRRILFLVGDPDGHDGDYAASIPSKELTAVETRTESLAQALLVETEAGASWEFTVREGDLDGAVETLATRVGERLLAEVREARDSADETEDRSARIDALETALAAFQRVATLDMTVQDESAGESVREAAESVIDDLVGTRLERARDRRFRGNWDAQAGNETTATDYFADARADYERALELADSYPPGDAADIADRLASLDDRIEQLSLTAQIVSRADDD